MKKLILLVMTALIAITGVFNINSCASSMTNKNVITPHSAFVSDTEQEDFSIQDAKNLQNFLLMRPTAEDLTDKNYDLDGNGIWNIFDLCLMKRKLIQTPNQNSNILVAYFSRTGTTEVIADYIINITDADTFEIEAAVPYTNEDIQYSNSSCRANKEQSDKNIRPEIANTIENIEQYDVIFVGYPIWWGEEPRIVDTFLESYDFSGATVIPFCTSHSSEISTSERNIKNLDVEYGEVLSGKRFSASSTEKDISEWLDTLPLENKQKTGVFNMQSKTVMLNSGYEMPIMGLGTYSLLDDTCVSSIVTELQNGGRLIDTAYMYHNEESVGEGIKQSGIPREEIFVETKLYPNQYANAANAIDEALEKLDVDYIDLMLLHHPGTNDVEAYKAMEQAVADGKIHSIGLSNWYIEELEKFLPKISIMPALIQNEIHPYYQEIDVVPYIQSLGIVMQGWYPLGGRGYTAELLGDETIKNIAENHGVSSAQVILRWNLQRNVVVIPGSSNPDHIKENLDLFGFELFDNEMEQIKMLNRDEKHDWY